MTFPLRNLGELAHVFVGLSTKPARRSESERSSKVLTVRALVGNGTIDQAEFKPAEVGGRSAEKYRVQAGDVLLPARSTSIKVAVVPPELAGTIIVADHADALLALMIFVGLC